MKSSHHEGEGERGEKEGEGRPVGSYLGSTLPCALVHAGVRVIAIKPDQFRILLGAWSTSKGERACERMGPTAYGSRENQRGAGPLRFVPEQAGGPIPDSWRLGRKTHFVFILMQFKN